MDSSHPELDLQQRANKVLRIKECQGERDVSQDLPSPFRSEKTKVQRESYFPKVTEVASENRFKTRFKTRRPQPTLSLMLASEKSSLLGFASLLAYSPVTSHLLYSTPRLLSPGSELFTHSWPSPITSQSYHTLHACAFPDHMEKQLFPKRALC